MDEIPPVRQEHRPGLTIEVSPQAFYERFVLVETLRPDSSPIVRQVLENRDRIRALDLKFYAILGAIVTGLTGYGLIALGGNGA